MERKKKGKSNNKKEKEVYIVKEFVPPFLKNDVVAAGGKLVPAIERDGYPWYAESKEAYNKIVEILQTAKDNEIERKSKVSNKKEASQVLENNGVSKLENEEEKQVAFSKRIKEERDRIFQASLVLEYEQEHNVEKGNEFAKSLQEIYESGTVNPYVLIGSEIICLDEEYDWSSVLSMKKYDTLMLVRLIKEKGLPVLEVERTELIKKLAKYERRKFYNIVYEDLINYSEEFEKAYGMSVLVRALSAIGIQNGFNLKLNVNASSLPEDIKAAILFAFPVVKRER